jgi:hypothetical protein
MTECVLISVVVVAVLAYCMGVFIYSAFDRFAERMREDIEQTMRNLKDHP